MSAMPIARASVATVDSGTFMINEVGEFVWVTAQGEYKRMPRYTRALRGVKFIGVSASTDNVYQFCALVSTEGKVYTWGANNFGRLGHGNYEPVDLPMQVIALNQHRVLSVSADCHCLALTDSGLAFGWGPNHYGQCGNPNRNTHTPTEPDILIPLQIQIPAQSWRSASVGGNNSLLVSKFGELYAFGSNFHGQLGNGSFDDDEHPIPSIVRLRAACIDAAVGTSQSLAVIANGDLFAWGRDHEGELGVAVRGQPVDIFPIMSRAEPGQRRRGRVPVGVLSTYAQQFDEFAAYDGPYAPCQVIESPYNRFYHLPYHGRHHPSQRGQEGVITEGATIPQVFSRVLPDHRGPFSRPQLVSHLMNVSSVLASGSQSCAVTGDGKLFIWGTRVNRAGRSITVSLPTAVRLTGRVRMASISNLSNVAVMENGLVVQWGEDDTRGQKRIVYNLP